MVVKRLTEHDDVIKPLLRVAPRLDLALGPAPAGAGPAQEPVVCFSFLNSSPLRHLVQIYSCKLLNHKYFN